MKTDFSVETILDVLETGLVNEDLESFKEYMRAEIGTIRKEFAKGDGLRTFKLTAKGKDRVFTAKASVAAVEFKGVNTARLVLHFAISILTDAEKFGVAAPIVDVSKYAEGWLERRNEARAERQASATA